MVIAVYMNDENLFDNIWKYEQLHLDRSDGTGLMNWYINADGSLGTNGGGAATDGDEDMAWALLMASRQWGGSGTLGNTYLNLAVAQINNVYNKEVSGGILVAGDSWTPINPSYFAPAYYREFAAATGQNGWLTVAANCYTVLNANLGQGYGNATNGLDSAWCNSSGVSQNTVNSSFTDYQYDACRTPFRIVQDYIWFGNSSAQSYDTKTSNFFSAIGAVSIVDGYHLDGTKDAQLPTLTVSQNPGFQSAAFVGPAGCGAMVSNSYQGYLDSTYSDLVGSKLLVGGTYYDESWTVMSLLMLSDNFLDYNMYIPPTPTPTLSAYAPMTLRVNCGGPQFADSVPQTWLADQQYSGAVSWGWIASANNVSPYTGQTIANTTNNQQTLYQTERWGNPTYQFNIPNGYYQVLFKFCENYDADSHNGGRVFSVVEAGDPVITGLDVYKTVGEHVAYDVPTTCVVSTGQLDIVFSSTADSSQVNAIQIIRIQTPPTPTVTNTKVPTASDTPTPTISYTPGGATATQTPTFTVTSTPTRSFTSTPTNSMTFTLTATPTYTLSLTRTFTPSVTATFTPTSTVIFTSTPTASFTSTRTATSTATSTSVFTSTLTTTSTASLTSTRTSTPTSTATAVFTSTVTPTYTSTVTSTRTSTPTVTTTYSSTFTNTNTGTSTLSPTRTLTPVLSYTFTPTATSTLSPTVTSTSTATGTFTPIPSKTFTPVFSSTYTFTATSTTTMTPTGTLTPSQTSTSVFSFTPTWSPTNTPTATFTRTSTPTFSPSLTATQTSTPTKTNSPIFTYTSTMTSTQTPTPTLSWTATPSATFTAVWSNTPTTSPTPQPVLKPVIYPNPADGTRPVLVRFPSSGTSDGKIQLFTTAFRKVLDIPLHAQNGGTDYSFELKDQKGNLLASGLYYLVLTNNQGRQILKLIVLR